jgi:hypothetical protein
MGVFLTIGYINMDTINFIEQYCLVNGEHIKLKDYQKKFIKWVNQLKSETES